MEKLQKALGYIADATETGYSALYTFGVKEILNYQERQALARILQNLAVQPDLLVSLQEVHPEFPQGDFHQDGERMCISTHSPVQ